MDSIILDSGAVNEPPIIDGVLCYTSTSRHVMRNDDIVRVCLAFYEDDDILRAKDILYEKVGEKIRRKRGENRIIQEIQDILDMLKKCDDDKIMLPKFVVDRYDGLPPSAGFEVIAQTMVTLKNEMTALKREIESLRENRLEENQARQDSEILKEDLLIIKGELRKLNHKIMSDEIRRDSLLLESLNKSNENKLINSENAGVDLSHKEINEDNGNYDGVLTGVNSVFAPSAPLLTGSASLDLVEILDKSFQDDGGIPSAPSYADVVNGKGTHYSSKDELSSSRKSDTKRRSYNKEAAVNDVSGDDIAKSLAPMNVDNEGFRLVQGKQKQRTTKNVNIIGCRKVNKDGNCLKSAPRVLDLYLGNVDIDASCDSVEKYILQEMNIKIVKCEELLSKNRNCKSFKISVNVQEREKLLSPDAWPENVVCRKFFSSRKSNKS